MRVLVVDDEPQILRALADQPAGPPVRRDHRRRRQHRTRRRQEPEARPPDPRPRAPRHRRRRRHPLAAIAGPTCRSSCCPAEPAAADKIVALNAGADDYVTKPFNIEELLARIRAVSRRLRPEIIDDEPVEVGQYTVDLTEKAIRSSDSELVHLTKTEWDLLAILVRNPGKLVSQRQLLQDVWGPTYLNETHYLRQYMAQLRKKLEPDPTRPRHLLTEPGMGYRFMP